MSDERAGRRWLPKTKRRATFNPELAGCALDLAEEHPDGMLLDDIAAELGVTGEAIRLVEERALRRLRALGIDQIEHVVALIMGGKR